jgi:hypothetical protein
MVECCHDINKDFETSAHLKAGYIVQGQALERLTFEKIGIHNAQL